jgi:hypothetical protein
MYRRPFISPLLKRPLPLTDGEEDVSLQKRACLGMAKPFVPPIARLPCGAAGAGAGAVPRTPLLNLQIPTYAPAGTAPALAGYFTVLWRKQTMRKNKTWDGDGVLALEEGSLTLRDAQGNKYFGFFCLLRLMDRMGTRPWVTGTLSVGDMIVMGNKDVEVCP